MVRAHAETQVLVLVQLPLLLAVCRFSLRPPLPVRLVVSCAWHSLGSGMAVHHQTGETLPRELFQKLREQRAYQVGLRVEMTLLTAMWYIYLRSTTDATG
jgi:hypothetical protein